jgi:hypothetical protein
MSLTSRMRKRECIILLVYFHSLTKIGLISIRKIHSRKLFRRLSVVMTSLIF